MSLAKQAERHALAKYLQATREYAEIVRVQPDDGTQVLLAASRCKLAGRAWVQAELEAKVPPKPPPQLVERT